MWRRRPAWLYLPAQDNQLDDVAAKRRRISAASDVDHGGSDHLTAPTRGENFLGHSRGGERGQDADPTPGIRGRGASPGASAGSGIGPSGHDGGDGIRGPRHGPGALQGSRRATAQEQLDARNAHLRRSLQDHAERVEKRRSEGRPSGQVATGSDRLIALRARVAARQRERQGLESGQHDQAGDRQASSSGLTSSCSLGMNEGNLAPAAVPRTSNEDGKMHSSCPASRIRLPSASRPSTGDVRGGAWEADSTAEAVTKQAGGRSAEGDPRETVAAATRCSVPPAGAVVAASRQVAWHTAASWADSAP